MINNSLNFFKEFANAVGDRAAALIGIVVGLALEIVSAILWIGTRLPLVGGAIQLCWYYTFWLGILILIFWGAGATCGLLYEAWEKHRAVLGATKAHEAEGYYRPGAHDEWHVVDTSDASTRGWVVFDVVVGAVWLTHGIILVIAVPVAIAIFFVWRWWKKKKGGTLPRTP